MKQLFPAGKPVSGNMLIGRKTLLTELTQILAIGQSIVLIAPRRYGKTSIALEILNQFKTKDWFISEIDIFNITDKQNFSEKIIESCLKNNPISIASYWHKLKSGAVGILYQLRK